MHHSALMPLSLSQSPAKPVSSGLTQQVREMRQRVAQLEEERVAAQSRKDIEKKLQIQVSGYFTVILYHAVIITCICVFVHR